MTYFKMSDYLSGHYFATGLHAKKKPSAIMCVSITMNFLRFIFIVFLVSVASESFAHTGFQCSRSRLYRGGNPIQWNEPPKRPYDILKYELTLDWRSMFVTKTPQFTGVNRITLKLTQQSQLLEFDASYMKIDSILINNQVITPTPQQANEKLTVALPASLQDTNQILIVTIRYSRNSTKDTGMYFYPKGTWDSYTRDSTKEDIAYTMSEPIDAHYWMPCNDRPSDKAQSEISIIVPNGIEASSNGILVDKSAYDANSTQWHFKSDEPIATYLMVANASTFIHWSEAHQSTSAPGDTVHLDYYAWPADYYQDSLTDRSHFNARYNLSRVTSGIMTWLEARFGHFPFVKYGQVPISPFQFGGMEHQTLTSIHRQWLKGNDDGISHEMTHQWFGDKTTCESFKDLWLNEGFATFGESLWAEAWGGNEWYLAFIRGDAQGYFNGDHTVSVYDPPQDNLFNGATVYAKGACILHMLRRMVNNDTTFFGALQDYSNTFAYTTANTAQLRDFLSQRLGIDLYDFFDEWVFNPLHPNYDITWAQNASNMLFIRINQYQQVRDHFTMPVEFLVYHGSHVDSTTVNNFLRTQRYQIPLDYHIDSLRFDYVSVDLGTYITATGDTVYAHTVDTTRVLRLPYAAALAVNDVPVNSRLRVYYEGNEITCKFDPVVSSGVIEIFNALGVKLIREAVYNGESLKKIDTRVLPAGAYILQLSTGEKTERTKINIIR